METNAGMTRVTALRIAAETAITALTAAASSQTIAFGTQQTLIKAAALTGQFLRLMFLDEQTAITDQMAFNLTRSFDELATKVTEEFTHNTQKTAGDEAAVTDAAVNKFIKGLSDVMGLTDVAIIGMAKRLDDAPVVSEQFTHRFSTGRADTFQAVEGPGYDEYAYGYFLEDYARDGRPAIKLIKSRSDAASMTDSSFRLVNKGLNEPVALTETINRYMTRSLADGVGVTDDLDGALSTEDEQTMRLMKSFTDGFVIGDTFARVVFFTREPVDPVGLTDASTAQIGKASSDAIGITDPAALALSKPATDAFAATDTTTKSVSQAKTDSAAVTDSGSLRMQSYCDFSYFAEDYVGTYTTF